MSPLTPFRPLVSSRTYRSLAFLAAAVPVAAVTLGLMVAGWTSAGVLAITPLVVPVLIAFRGAIGLLACADGMLAGVLLGVEVTPRISSGGHGFWGRGKAVLADGAFWRQQAYLLLRMVAGFGFAVGVLSLVAASAGWAVLPLWYRWADLSFGSWDVDSFARSLVFVPAGIAGLVVAGWLAQLLGAVSAWLARVLPAGGAGGRAFAPTRPARRLALAIHAGVATGLVALVVVIWALTSRGYFWPEWVLLPLGLLLAVHGLAELVEERPALRRRRGLALDAGVLAALLGFLVLVWALTSRGYFWPAWPLLAAAIVLASHAALAHAAGRGRLARRVGVLEATRAGAVEEQEVALRRIERDLHDGAQARLVALGMNLGMAEQKLATDPEGAQRLVTEARAAVAEALRELRDLARGIHPPVLSDRGLGAALETLAGRSALPVSVEVADDGGGGADPAGAGLTGLRRRVEALDGTLEVTSPAGGPTTIRAELPCGS